MLIGTHYRQSLNFSFKALEDARAALQRLDAFQTRLRENAGNPDGDISALQPVVAKAIADFGAALADDLNVSAAFAALFDLVREVNRLLDAAPLGGNAVRAVQECLSRMDSVLAICQPEADQIRFRQIQALAEERQQLERQKIARADVCAKTLDEQGWLVEDAKPPRVLRK